MGTSTVRFGLRRHWNPVRPLSSTFTLAWATMSPVNTDSRSVPSSDGQSACMALDFVSSAATPAAANRQILQTRRSKKIPAVRVLRIKPRSPSSVEADAQQVERNYNIGHGQIFLSGESALQAILHLEMAVEQLRHQNQPCDFKMLVRLLHLQSSFNHQLIECGKAHLKWCAKPTRGQVAR